MTSLTPQGGGEAPKNVSGRLVAATWWLFGLFEEERERGGEEDICPTICA